MTNRAVDRGDGIAGLLTTGRDHRLPENVIRQGSNFSMPDRRARRREGYAPYSTETFNGQALAKVKGNEDSRKLRAITDGIDFYDRIAATPTSYAVIQHHDAIQPATDKNWTIEFSFVTGERDYIISSNARKRETYKLYGTGVRQQVRADVGALLYDCAVYSNSHKFIDTDDASASAVPETSGDVTRELTDTFVLSAISIGYSEDFIRAHCTMLDDSDNYHVFDAAGCNLEYAIPNYSKDTVYHVAVRYNSSSRAVTLVVNNSVEDTFTVPADWYFAGEEDRINDLNIPIRRDAVILNECTVRGQYSSTIKLTHAESAPQSVRHFSRSGPLGTAFENYGRILNLSPPLGTRMYELRWWNAEKTLEELEEFRYTKLDDDLEGKEDIVGYWPLDDGAGVCFNRILDSTYHAYVHSAHAQYIRDPDLLHGIGLRFGDGQYAALSFNEGDYQGIRDLHTSLVDIAVGDFTHRREFIRSVGTNWLNETVQDANSCTYQFQIKTPPAYQQELDIQYATPRTPGNRDALDIGPGVVNPRERPIDKTLVGSSPNAVEITPYRLISGRGHTLANTQGEQYTRNTSGVAQRQENCQYHPAYDQTIFSWETRPTDEISFPILSVAVVADGSFSTGKKFVVVIDDEFPEWVEDGWTANLIGVQITATSAFTGLSITGDGEATGVNTVEFEAPSAQAIAATTAFTVTSAFINVYPQNNTIQERRKVPLYRVLLTPTGRIAFEFFGDGREFYEDDWRVRACYHRFETVDPLPVDTVQTITIVKSTIYDNSIPTAFARAGWRVDIYIDGVLDAFNSFNVLNVGPDGASNRKFSRAQRSRLAYDLVLGASYIDSGWDQGIDTPMGSASGWRLSSPESIGGHAMVSRFDAPGNFVLGFFRMWQGAISTETILATIDQTLVAQSEENQLLINLEVDTVSSRDLASKARYPEVFQLNYKSWTTHEAEYYRPGAHPRYGYQWNLEDCLGYKPKDTNFLPQSGCAAKTNYIGFFNAVLTQSFAVAAIIKDTPLFDRQLTGQFQPIPTPVYGLMSDFSPDRIWNSAVIGDKLFMTSNGNIPKVFNGKTMGYIGFPEYRGPILQLDTIDAFASGAFDTSSGPVYVGVVVVYFNESDNTQQFSKRLTLKIPADFENAILRVFDVPAHPDPRVTTIRIYRTLEQQSQNLAENAPVFLCPTTITANQYSSEIRMYDRDENLGPPLDITITDIPDCEFVAAFAGRLWLIGSFLFPDTVFYSRAGNPQEFDQILDQIVLEESDGDRINGAYTINNALYIFKPSAIWRIDQAGDGFQATRVSSIGAISNRSIDVVTIPDEGRTVIAFWSKHGPYVFDGINLQYIGYPIEELEINEQYEWLEDLDVFVMHHLPTRELVWFYKLPGEDRYSEAVTYNYRYNAWSRFTGVSGTYAASSTTAVDFINQESGSSVVLQSVQPQRYRTFLGGHNGVIYTWGTSKLDGFLSDTTISQTISGYSNPVITLAGNLTGVGVNELHGLWLTIRRGNRWYSHPILYNTANTVTLDSYKATPFNPAVGDIVYVGQPPLELITPWDNLGNPLSEKNGVHVSLHLDGTFSFGWAKDWDDAVFTNAEITDPNRKRKLVRLENVNAEVVKTRLISFDLESRVDSIMMRLLDSAAPHRANQ